MNFMRKLPIPQEVKAMYPLNVELESIKRERDEEIRAIFEEKSNRFLLIIGPCSADDAGAVLDYTVRLKAVAEKVKDKILIIPRVFTNKPRTLGDGYLGMLYQPDTTKDPDVLKGVVAVRALNMRILEETGFTCADELLYPDTYRYISDLLSYVTVGARSVENQQHRLTASGLDIPVGMKNPIREDYTPMLNAVDCARNPHRFIYRGWEVQSRGNALAHYVLRGFGDGGACKSNFSYDCLRTLFERSRVDNGAVIVDANHANSGKNYKIQPEIVFDVLQSRRKSKEIGRFVKGVMVESYIEDGAQSFANGVYGKSITDPCLGWEKTQKLIFDMAEML